MPTTPQVRLTLLQEATIHARYPNKPQRSFAAERRAAGFGDALYENTAGDACMLSAGRILLPGAKSLVAGLVPDFAAMLEPLKAAGAQEHEAFAKPMA